MTVMVHRCGMGACVDMPMPLEDVPVLELCAEIDRRMLSAHEVRHAAQARVRAEYFEEAVATEVVRLKAKRPLFPWRLRLVRV